MTMINKNHYNKSIGNKEILFHIHEKFVSLYLHLS